MERMAEPNRRERSTWPSLWPRCCAATAHGGHTRREDGGREGTNYKLAPVSGRPEDLRERRDVVGAGGRWPGVRWACPS